MLTLTLTNQVYRCQEDNPSEPQDWDVVPVPALLGYLRISTEVMFCTHTFLSLTLREKLLEHKDGFDLVELGECCNCWLPGTPGQPCRECDEVDCNCFVDYGPNTEHFP